MVLAGAAVSFFFVLSGFILTYVYKDHLTYGKVKKFYYKRWARIWPLHLVCMLVAIFSIGIVIQDWTMFGVNLGLLHSWVPRTPWVFSFNGVSWSISTEMFFYFMFPFLLIGGQKKFWFKFAILWALVIGVLVGIQYLQNNPQQSFYDFSEWDFDRVAHVNPFLRLPEFCTGMAIGFLFFNRAARRKRRSVWIDTIGEILALSLIPIFSLTYRHYKVTWNIRHAEWGGDATALWVQYSGMVLVFAVIIYVFSRSNGWIAKILGSRWLVFAGEISFALYMIHYLVIISISRLDWSASTYSPWVLGACAIVISICLAAFLYKLVEMPAKTALLALSEGKLKKFLLAFPAHFLNFAKTPTFWCYLVLFGASIGTLYASYSPLNVDSRMQQVVAQSHGPYRDVNFGQLIRLMGAKATPTARGIELEMVWQKKAPLHRLRFTHFCDDEGNILSQLGPQQEVFDDAGLLQPVMEKVLIPNFKLEDPKITQIGVGFYSAENDPKTGKRYAMLPASKGPRGMSNFRLYVIGANQLKNLRKQLENLKPATSVTKVEQQTDTSAESIEPPTNSGEETGN